MIACKNSIVWTAPLRGLLTCCLIAHLFGCTTYGRIDNDPMARASTGSNYSVRAFTDRFNRGENSVMLAFSGGGTRAAALSYGVLKALNEIIVETESGRISLLDGVDTISSVSGGSFTSAYYGLYGKRIFENFESNFLRKDVQGDLIHRLANPFSWFKISHRTEWAINYYQQTLFKNATFADLQEAGGPLIIINASDVAGGVDFWFTQEHFDLLCSDIDSFPVATAVAASSAVPGLFAPVVLENFKDCPQEEPQVIEQARAAAAQRPELELVLRGMESYADKEKRPYIHLVDGGITDNLGMRGFLDVSQLSGGMVSYFRQRGRTPPKRIVVMSVDASTESAYEINQSNRIPPVTEVVSAVTKLQLHRYSAATLALMRRELRSWSKELAAAGHPVETYFIRIDLEQVEDPEERDFLNRIPTSFSLTDKQVDALIETGGHLLRNNPEFRRLMADAGFTP
jgi:NTE family protein